MKINKIILMLLINFNNLFLMDSIKNDKIKKNRFVILGNGQFVKINNRSLFDTNKYLFENNSKDRLNFFEKKILEIIKNKLQFNSLEELAINNINNDNNDNDDNEKLNKKLLLKYLKNKNYKEVEKHFNQFYENKIINEKEKKLKDLSNFIKTQNDILLKNKTLTQDSLNFRKKYLRSLKTNIDSISEYFVSNFFSIKNKFKDKNDDEFIKIIENEILNIQSNNIILKDKYEKIYQFFKYRDQFQNKEILFDDFLNLNLCLKLNLNFLKDNIYNIIIEKFNIFLKKNNNDFLLKNFINFKNNFSLESSYFFFDDFIIKENLFEKNLDINNLFKKLVENSFLKLNQSCSCCISKSFVEFYSNLNLNFLNNQELFNYGLLEDCFTQDLTKILKKNENELIFLHELGHGFEYNNGFIAINTNGFYQNDFTITTGITFNLNLNILECCSIIPSKNENPLLGYATEFYNDNNYIMSNELFFTLFILHDYINSFNDCKYKKNLYSKTFCLDGDFERSFNLFNIEKTQDKNKQFKIENNEIKELIEFFNNNDSFEFLKLFLINFSDKYLNQKEIDENLKIDKSIEYLLFIKKRFIDSIDLQKLKNIHKISDKIYYEEKENFNQNLNMSYFFLSELQLFNQQKELNMDLNKKEEKSFDEFLKKNGYEKEQFFKIKILPNDKIKNNQINQEENNDFCNIY